jgi:hypothetical protein
VAGPLNSFGVAGAATAGEATLLPSVETVRSWGVPTLPVAPVVIAGPSVATDALVTAFVVTVPLVP